MIKTIENVKGIGRLVLPPALVLSQWSVIYAPNGGGKSTTSLLFRSLARGDSTLLDEAQALPGPVPQTATITTDDPPPESAITLVNGAWSRAVPTLRVFDARFAYENLYIGNTVNPEQKASLHRFVLGDDNVALARRVDEIDAEIRQLNDDMAKLEKLIASRSLPIPVNDFLVLDVDPTLDEKEKDLKVRIDVAERVEQLRVQALLRRPVSVSLNVHEVARILGKTVPGIAEESLRRAMDHTKHLGVHGSHWIAQGLEFAAAAEELCPFCNASLKDNELVLTFRRVFTQSYGDLRKEVTATAASVRGVADGTAATSGRAILEFNEGLSNFWKAEGVAVPSRELWEGAYQCLQNAAKALLPPLEAKELAPHSSFADPEPLARCFEALEKAQEGFLAYDTALVDCNAAIQARKALAEAADLQHLLRQQDHLRAVRERQQPETKDSCARLLGLRQRKVTLTKEKNDSKLKLEASVDSLTPQLVRGINDFLRLAGADFSLKSIATTYPGGIPRAEYVVSLRKTPIPASKKAGAPHHVGNVLSEGDRSTLAFAFFLARLQAESNKENLVVVVDDPVNSMDSGRRGITCESLLSLAKECGQLVLLSHDSFFLKSFVERFPSSKVDEVARFQLKKVADDSTFETWDLDLATQSDYEARYKVVSAYVRGGAGDLLAVATALRPLLEGYLRRRFPGDLGDARMLGTMLNNIKTAPAGSVLASAKDDLGELNALNNFAKQFHHDDGAPSPTPPVDAVELTAMATATLGFVVR